MERKQLKKLARDVSHGLFATVTDITLFSLYVTVASISKTPTSYGTHRAFDEAETMLRQLNHATLLRVLRDLNQKKMVQVSGKQSKQLFRLTPAGIRYLKEQLPKYRLKRPWNGRTYLITYDIPETHHRHRTELRTFIKHHGAAMLQESVWLTLRDPRPILRQIVAEKNLSGIIIVSDMGRDGSIGDDSLSSLIQRLYRIDQLNERYKAFIEGARNSRSTSPHLISWYLSILTDDPQLPQELLPANWLGERAYDIYRKMGGKYLT